MLLLFQAAQGEEPPVEPPAPPVPTAVFLPPAFGRKPYRVKGRTEWLTEEQWAELVTPKEAPKPTRKARRAAKQAERASAPLIEKAAQIEPIEYVQETEDDEDLILMLM